MIDLLFLQSQLTNPYLHSFPTRRSSDLLSGNVTIKKEIRPKSARHICRFISLTFPDGSSHNPFCLIRAGLPKRSRSEEHTSELQSRGHLVCRLLLEKKKKTNTHMHESHQ